MASKTRLRLQLVALAIVAIAASSTMGQQAAPVERSFWNSTTLGPSAVPATANSQFTDKNRPLFGASMLKGQQQASSQQPRQQYPMQQPRQQYPMQQRPLQQRPMQSIPQPAPQQPFRTEQFPSQSPHQFHPAFIPPAAVGSSVSAGSFTPPRPANGTVNNSVRNLAVIGERHSTAVPRNSGVAEPSWQNSLRRFPPMPAAPTRLSSLPVGSINSPSRLGAPSTIAAPSSNTPGFSPPPIMRGWPNSTRSQMRPGVPMDPLSTVQGRDSAPANTRVAAVPQVAPAANSIYRAPPQNGIPNAAPPIHTGIDNSSWWHKAQLQPVLAKSSQQPISVEQIVLESLQHSLRLQIDATSPQQSQNDIFEAAAEFDWEAFVDSSWRDLTEPSGSQLITGGTRSLRNSEFSYEAGFRRRNQVGGDLSLSQQFGLEDSNSDFFTPPRQGQTRMSLSYTQPLLRGAGRKYNLSGVVRAELNNEIARQEFFTRVQDHLVSVRQAYWDLYYARAFLIQQRKLAQLAGEILHELRLRENVDGAKDQLLRVTASVSSREAALIRAEKDVVDAQAQLRRLVNSPMLLEFVSTEFIPQDTPSWRPSGNNREWLLQQAIQFRPEVISSLREIKVASVQYQVTSNELLPQLNLVLTTYVLGLRGERDINTAFRDQFSSGQPSYSVGLTVEMPWGNRAANARHRNAEIQIQRMKREFQLSVEQVWLEVDSAIRELETSYQEMQAHQIVMRRYNDQLSYLNTRRQWLPQGNRTGSLYLEDLLNAQVRVVDAEMDYLRSQIDFTMAEVSLQRATGTMLR